MERWPTKFSGLNCASWTTGSASCHSRVQHERNRRPQAMRREINAQAAECEASESARGTTCWVQVGPGSHFGPGLRKDRSNHPGGQGQGTGHDGQKSRRSGRGRRRRFCWRSTPWTSPSRRRTGPCCCPWKPSTPNCSSERKGERHERSQIAQKIPALLLRDRVAHHFPVQHPDYPHDLQKPGGGGGLWRLHGPDRGEEHRRGAGGGYPDPVHR